VREEGVGGREGRVAPRIDCAARLLQVRQRDGEASMSARSKARPEDLHRHQQRLQEASEAAARALDACTAHRRRLRTGALLQRRLRATLFALTDRRLSGDSNITRGPVISIFCFK